MHVTDSEGHKYWLMERLRKRGHRFIIRLAREHKARELADDEWDLVSNLVGKAEDVAERSVPLPARTGKRPPKTKKTFPDRQSRVAKLRFGKMQLALKKPSYLGNDVAPETVVNVVRVYEVDAPAEVEPVEWILFTSEPIATAEDVLAVVDNYRKRWVIEDFFRALKTGTSYELRQLESARAWKNVLAISLPIAWRLLAIRTAAREQPNEPATTIFTTTELAALRHRLPKRLPQNPTRREAVLVLAELGGHHKSNGEPGWQILHRAWMKLLPLVEGMELARKM
ncbi:MAG: IS4 family transposase [Archangiaceae bacterium]|nr:IS4 family transposase [Archangiaceae bacterium]